VLPNGRAAFARPLIQAIIETKVQMSDQNKPGNLRTALILLSVAVAFFVGVIIKHTLLR
jgi:hypothetical protein